MHIAYTYACMNEAACRDRKLKFLHIFELTRVKNALTHVRVRSWKRNNIFNAVSRFHFQKYEITITKIFRSEFIHRMCVCVCVHCTQPISTASHHITRGTWSATPSSRDISTINGLWRFHGMAWHGGGEEHSKRPIHMSCDSPPRRARMNDKYKSSDRL